jgi:hypothetical protein
MQIESVRRIERFLIEITDGDSSETRTYERSGPSSWDEWCYESLEPVYDKEELKELEKLFQDHQSRHLNEISP